MISVSRTDLTRSTKRPSRLRWFAGFVTALLALAIVPNASALIEQYWNDYLTGNTAAYSTSHSWRTNRVWRPAGNDFALWFDVSGSQFYWAHNSASNPFTLHAPSNITSQAACHNRTASLVDPVTCQVYDYNA